jgi:hypothetical protein
VLEASPKTVLVQNVRPAPVYLRIRRAGRVTRAESVNLIEAGSIGIY